MEFLHSDAYRLSPFPQEFRRFQRNRVNDDNQFQTAGSGGELEECRDVIGGGKDHRRMRMGDARIWVMKRLPAKRGDDITCILEKKEVYLGDRHKMEGKSPTNCIFAKGIVQTDRNLIVNLHGKVKDLPL
jgi:hypothetical protein